ncbi:MAG TPA: 2Fe-2S iron-sulfur cluster-binding protein, partial [Planctomycetaceae bacterium]|nr:2Fe-2S iron-sulfur cluster-binding protein [Planctomycetaceae bacterium]
MATIIIDGREIEIGDDERLNVIQAADRAGVPIPFYCWHPGLTVVASCRMCLVETGTKNKETGKIEMIPKLVPACQTPAKDGTVVVTDSPRVKANQQFVQEGLLLDHPIDCSICDQAGECWLQDYYFNYGQPERRADVRPFTSERRDLGEHVTLFVDRCVMCSRCVRFTREVSGTAELQVINRGAHAEIDIFPGYPVDNHLSGNVNDLCPVGALCSKDFLYTQRVWFMEPHDSVCTRCSTGCAIQVQENNGHLYRIQPRYNPNANDWWMCDIGRFNNEFVHAPDRLGGVKKRVNDRFEDVHWPNALHDINAAILDVDAKQGGAAIAAVLSPFLTCEEAYLLASYFKKISHEIQLVLGKVPVVGQDEVFPKGFTIRAERCPNRRGVEEIIQHFQQNVTTWDQLLPQLDSGKIQAVYVTANYPDAWIDDAEAARFDKVPLKIVQDILASPLARRAQWVVPGVTFAEKAGSYVNHAGLIQMTDWGIRPHEGAHVDGQTFSDLLGRRGLYQAADVTKELASQIPFFARAKDGIPESGLNLVTGQEKHPATTQLGTVTHPLPTFRSVASPMIEVEGLRHTQASIAHIPEG